MGAGGWASACNFHLGGAWRKREGERVRGREGEIEGEREIEREGGRKNGAVPWMPCI